MHGALAWIEDMGHSDDANLFAILVHSSVIPIKRYWLMRVVPWVFPSPTTMTHHMVPILGNSALHAWHNLRWPQVHVVQASHKLVWKNAWQHPRPTLNQV